MSLVNEKVWKPHERQAEFLSIPDTIFEALYGGAAGGGKSDCLLLLPIARQFHLHPRFKGIIFRRTYPELEAEVIVRSMDWYRATGAAYSSDKRRWTWPSGAIMQFGHCEYEQDIRKYDSAEYNYMAFDELTSFTEFQYMYISHTRCRSSVPELPSIVRSGTNPGNIGHAWVRSRFIEAGPSNTIIKDKSTGNKRIFIPCKATDNPYIDPNYVTRLSALPEAERAAKLDGDWYTFEGQVFSDFRPLRLSNEPENAVHVVEPFEIPSWWPRILAVDWGFAAMTYAVFGALSPDNRLYIYDEYSAVQKPIVDWCGELRQKIGDQKIDSTVLCRSAWQNRGEEKLLAEQFRDIVGITPAMPDNNRIAGKLAIQEYLRWRPRTPNKILQTEFNQDFAISLLRNKGQKAYEDYLDSFKPQEPEDNLPKLQIFSHCSLIQQTLPLCIYDKKNNTTAKVAEDVKEFQGDDPYDALRYLVLKAMEFKDALKKESGYRSEVAKVITNFEKTHDYTSLHRQMEKVEREKSLRNKPVRRFRRAFG